MMLAVLGRLTRWALAALLAAGVSLLCAPCALALAPEGEPLGLSGPDEVSMAFLDVRELPFATDPASIEVGISCGMKGMCGEDPCLCGSSDAWGRCSCNGLREVRPAFSIARADGADVGFLHVVDAFGKSWLVSCGSGEADAVLTAELEHYAPASVAVNVSAAPFGPLDALKALALVAVLAAVVAAVAFAVRAAVRAVGRAVGRRARRHAGGS